MVIHSDDDLRRVPLSGRECKAGSVSNAIEKKPETSIMPRYAFSLCMKSDMTAASRKQDFEMRGLGPRVVGIHLCRNPRIVEDMHHESGRAVFPIRA